MKNDRFVIKRNNFMFQLPYKLLRLKSISVLFNAMKSDIKVIRKCYFDIRFLGQYKG